MEKLKIVFMGSPDFAVPSLKVLFDHFNLVGVVTQPDRPKGRSRSKLYPSPVRDLADEHRIPVLTPEKLDEALSRVLHVEAALVKQESPALPVTGEPSDLGVRALTHYNKAKDYLRQGDWAGYGRELEQLENILKQLSKTSADTQ